MLDNPVLLLFCLCTLSPPWQVEGLFKLLLVVWSSKSHLVSASLSFLQSKMEILSNS